MVSLPIVAAMAGLAALIVRWGARPQQRPAPGRAPFVSIIVPSYRSPRLAETLRSLAALRYPKKELLVACDAPEPPTALCKQYGAKLIRFPSRQGKAVALNKASRMARGSVLFFVDSDTVVAPDCLSKLVPWFSDPAVAAVAPRFNVLRPRRVLERIATVEAAFNASVLRTHMRFGTLIAFRGCSVAIRAAAFRRLGGWPRTLAEDIDFSEVLLRAGHTIQYEPTAVVRTAEPATLRELQRQRVRWGRGAAFSFFTRRHRRYRRYLKSPQFLTYFSHGLFLFFALSALFWWQFGLTALPLLSLVLLSALPVKQALFLLSSSLSLLLSDLYLTAFSAALIHAAIVIAPTAGRREYLWLVPYLLFAVPVELLFYLQGVLIGIRDKRRRAKELDFRYW